MALLFDKRLESDNSAGFHALIIGISDYPYLPRDGDPSKTVDLEMTQLESAALSAWSLYKWLIKAHLPVPLKTCRILIAPSNREKAQLPELGQYAESCNLEGVLTTIHDWRRDVERNPENMTLFFFSGHGLEVSREPILVLQDFAKPIGPVLRATVAVSNIVNGMAPTSERPEIARRQLYFIDSCRWTSASLRYFEMSNSSAVFDLELPGIDDRTAPIFYAANGGQPAYAHSGKSSVFSAALVRCLEGAAAVSSRNEYGDVVWVVSVPSLMSHIQDEVNTLLAESGLEQRVTVSGAVRDSIICYTKAPSKVQVSIELDSVLQDGYLGIVVRDASLKPVFEEPNAIDLSHPYRVDLAPGYYLVEVKHSSGRGVSRLIDVSTKDLQLKVRASDIV